MSNGGSKTDMTKKGRRDKAVRENQARFARQNAEHARAVAAAAAQRKPVDGMKPVQLDSIADQLDEVDPHVRAALRTTPAAQLFDKPHRTELEDRATKPIAAPYRGKGGEFIPPRDNPFERREVQIMQNSADALFSSNERVRAKAGAQTGGRPGKPGSSKKPIRPFARLKVPADVVEAVGIERLESIDFEVELTDDGILYRPAGTRRVEVPSWAKREPAPALRTATTGGRA